MPQISRRGFLSRTAGGIALAVTPLSAILGSGPHAQPAGDPGAGWHDGPGKARYRVDGLRKVLGQKVYARDFRARDLDGWPQQEEWVLVMRAPFANRTLLGLDLEALPAALRPARIVTASDLARDHIVSTQSISPFIDPLVPLGTAPEYLGQAVALLSFASRGTMVQARLWLRSHDNRGLRAGPEMPRRPETYYQPETSLIRVVDGGKEVFSQVNGGPVHPENLATPRDREAMALVDEIRSRLDGAARRGLPVLRRTYHSQMVDPMFMEPESGLAWFDRAAGTLHLLIGTQSPGSDVEDVAELFRSPDCRHKVQKVNLISAYPGGGFGGRDGSTFCQFLALAAVNADTPVHIAHDRFDQFQAGIKRHPARIDVTLAADAQGRLETVRTHITLNGGGRQNVSNFVAEVAGLHGTGAYAVPYADVWARARRTRSQIAGSMRGFGSEQALFAIESLIDELSERLRIDPIELRRRNALAPGAPIATGARRAPPGLIEMCNLAEQHHLWRERDARKAAAAGTDLAYGVGFALGMKNYGSGADPVANEVAIDPHGRILVTTHAIDMGSGTATALSLATAASLGGNADDIRTGIVDAFDALELVEGFDPQPDNPRWTPIIFSSTKASATAGCWVHGVEQASLILLTTGLLPAAREIWGRDRSLQVADVHWVDGALVADGLPPIPRATLARRAHEQGHVVSAMIHAFFSGEWAEADYEVGRDTFRWQIDALAIRRGGQPKRALLDRRKPRLMTVEDSWAGNGQRLGATACLAAVTVHRPTGAVVLQAAVQFVNPGKVLQRDLVEGQMDGCFAMGVGQTLLEYLPDYEDGAGDGLWNLHRYHVPLSGDLALGRVEKVILPPETPDSPARGVAEVAMVAVAPAIANAIAHATGVRFRELPITAEKIMASWRA